MKPFNLHDHGDCEADGHVWNQEAWPAIMQRGADIEQGAELLCDALVDP